MTTGSKWTAYALFGLLTVAGPASAQNAQLLNAQPAPPFEPTGRVVGRVLDAETGTGLSNVVVTILGADVGTMTGIDGRFTLPRVPVGPVTLRAENLGYAPKQISDVQVPAGGVIEQNISLSPSAVQLDAIEVSAAAERGSVNRALEQQRTAIGIVSAITTEQMSRSPDGDAAAAMQRVSGVTVQDGKFVFVRGLGERYTTTSLNGARIPSPEPERKVVPLDLFPAGLLQTITTSKTFTPDQPGDFSGAQVDIRTREFPADRQITFSSSFGYNDVATGRNVLGGPREGAEWLAFAGSERRLPAGIAAAGNFQSGVTQEQMNGYVNEFRNTWSPVRREGSPNGSMGISVGGTDGILGQELSYLLSGSYSYTQEVQSEQVRARAQMGSTPGETEEINRFEGSTGRNSVLWGGLLNLSTLVGTHSRFALNTTYNRTADNEARVESGLSENHGQLPMQITRLRFVERSVLSSQLKAEHEFSRRQRADWSLTYSDVQRNEPDRSEFVYAFFPDAEGNPGRPTWFSAATEGAVRTFGEISEHSAEGAANYRLALSERSDGHYLRVGGQYRRTERQASSNAYSISSTRLSDDARAMTPEEIFAGQYSTPGSDVFQMTPLGQGGAYRATDRLLAGYLMAEAAITDRLQLVAGARVENSQVALTAVPTIGAAVPANPEYTDVLPALNLTFRMSESQNLRLSATRTLARPEYREIADITYRQVLGGESERGNPDLQRTLIDNLDARWEWYPNAGEVLSIALFAKRFQDPIERIYRGTSGTPLVTYVNAEGAENYGVELEFRKQLGLLHHVLEPITVFSNLTVMESRVDLAGDVAQGVADRAMVGQAPYVVNAGLTWSGGSGTSATVLYNLVGRKVYSASEAPLPVVFEEARQNLDLSLRFGLTSSIAAKFDAKNLLNEAYELTQGDVTREFYRSGRVYTMGLSWRR